MTVDQLITWIVVGGIAGWLAKAVVRGIRLGLAGTVLVGIVGGFVGGWLFRQLNVAIQLGNPLLTNIVTAFVGAVILLAILRGVR